MPLEGDRSRDPLPQLELDEPAELEPAGIPGGGNFVPRGLVGPELGARVAEALQEDLA